MNLKTTAKILLVLLIILAAGLGAFYYFKKPAGQDKNWLPLSPGKNAQASSFGTYSEVPVNISPRAADYSIAADLSNVTNLSDFTFLSDQAKQLLAKNGFAVTPGFGDEFFPQYETNRYALTPNFVTTDSILHNYHLMFNYLLEKLEKEKLAAVLKQLNADMLAAVEAQYDSAQGGDWANAAKRATGFFAVGSKLLDPAVTAPAYVNDQVKAELNLIEAHNGINISPLMNLGEDNQAPMDFLKEDYSQYIPRGHYDKLELLKAYFKSMMWYGRLTFRFKSEDEIKSAVLITLALSQEKNKANWDKIYEPTNFFVGKSDDISYFELKQVLDKVYGANVSLETLVNDKVKFAQLLEEIKNLKAPEINSMPIFDARFQPDRAKEIKGFRFMGQRYTIDAAIFQRLIYREVDGRYLPKGLDIPAAMGSSEAYNILSAAGETNYGNYAANLEKMKTYIAGLDKGIWTQNLYWGWLYALKPLTQEKGDGYPLFMKTLAWTRKQLNTFLANWTELKHDTILYAKQVYAELGGGGEQPVKDDRGYVEPEPYVYARLASLIKLTREGLDDRGLLDGADKDNLSTMEELAVKLKTIAEKELNGENLTDADYELIRSYGGQLEHFWLEINRADLEKAQMSQRNFLNQNPAALVTDVATDPNGQVLEEATGRINNLHVIAPVAGKLKILNGAVFSYYEFKWPLNDRLTDAKWREMLSGLLSSVKPPVAPDWTNAFTAQ